ncbi:MAG TPA: ATP-binding protein [Anaerolineae bacterium]|nr:ATP-binding protein [Anaerolineae bacterium]HQK13570.1 ATP-binding protein [Anaerolineae bacterium]
MVPKAKNETLKYDASTIQVLEGLEAVRRRPGMYVGGTDVRALHHLVYEVVDNSIDEALAGVCDHIRVIINADMSVSVIDNGRGIPVGIHPEKGISALQLVLTTLHAGGKFGGGGYKVSGGLHGVGVSAVNALSEWMEAVVKSNDGKIYRQRYERGIPVTPVEPIGKCDPQDTGTTVTFRFDPLIFKEPDITYSFETLAQRFREMAFVTRGVTIDLIDKREQPFPRQMSFHFEGGILSFVKYLDRNRKPLHDPIYVEKESEGVIVEVALQYTDSYSETVLAFANTINTVDGGTHLTGFRSALTRTINDVGRKLSVLKDNDPNLTGDDVREGLTAVISVKVPDPQFESQTKVKLMNPEVRFAVEAATAEAVAEFFEADPRAARRIVDKGLTASKARDAARKARDLVIRKSALESLTLPGKLADCSSRDPSNSELFIVEGDSAGGSAKQGRDRHFQAILPLRGKILNTERAGLNKILANKEVQALISALGCGVGDQFDLSNLRYGRTIIMSVDGDELTLVKNPEGYTQAVRIGPFIEHLWAREENPSAYQVLCFDPQTGDVRYKAIKSVIFHDHDAPLYEIETVYGRRIRVTGEHSLFVADPEGRPVLKRGDAICPGDVLAAPACLPVSDNAPLRIDLLSSFVEMGTALDADLVVRGPDVEMWYKAQVRQECADDPQVPEPHVTIPAYVATPGLEPDTVLQQVSVSDNRLDHTGNTRYKAAPRNRVRTWVAIQELRREDLAYFDGNVTLTPRHYADQAMTRYIPVNESLMFLLGFFVAEGALSTRNGVRLAIGNRNKPVVPELIAAIRQVFGIEPTLYQASSGRAQELRILNRVVTSVFRLVFGFDDTPSNRKHIPDIVFNVTPSLQLAFLRGYFMGDGTLSECQVSFSTTSETLANQLMYLLLMHKINVSLLQREPTGEATGIIGGKPVSTRHTAYYLAISSRESVAALEPVWRDHPRAEQVRRWLDSPRGKDDARLVTPMIGDLIGLPVRAVRQIEATHRRVYDFSVEGDETFICGRGGLCAHNTDADVDGAHITTLLLTFFFRYMQPLIENGHLYIAQPPLYLVKSGKDEQYAYSDSDLEQVLKAFEGRKVVLQRYKGLGEMNPQQLWETTMDPAKRTLVQVTIEDAAEADQVFSMLMGSEVPPRRRFIQSHAREVQNLDV